MLFRAGFRKVPPHKAVGFQNQKAEVRHLIWVRGKGQKKSCEKSKEQCSTDSDNIKIRWSHMMENIGCWRDEVGSAACPTLLLLGRTSAKMRQHSSIFTQFIARKRVIEVLP